MALFLAREKPSMPHLLLHPVFSEKVEDLKPLPQIRQNRMAIQSWICLDFVFPIACETQVTRFQAMVKAAI